MSVRPFSLIVLVAFVAGLGLPFALGAVAQNAQTANKKKAVTPVKKSTPTKTASKATPKKSASARNGVASNKKRVASKSYTSSNRKPPVAPRRSGQASPTNDRYVEIQEAMIAKGYMQGPASGNWDTNSSDALRRFQIDKNLPATGKLTSMSLIQLGLGPKRLAQSSTPVLPSSAEPKPLQQ